MVCTYFKSRDWTDLIEFCGKNKANNYEKIFASLYFHSLQKYSKMGNSYPLTVCVETFMNIDKVVSYLRDISSANGFNYQISTSQSSVNDMLKVADIVAAIGRKDRNACQKYNFVEFSHPEINILKEYLRKFK
jgi:pentose-5-phosphate-3-epimerase